MKTETCCITDGDMVAEGKEKVSRRKWTEDIFFLFISLTRLLNLPVSPRTMVTCSAQLGSLSPI